MKLTFDEEFESTKTPFGSHERHHLNPILISKFKVNWFVGTNKGILEESNFWIELR